MKSMWNLVSNYEEDWNIVQYVFERATVFVIPADPRGRHRLIKMVVSDIAERYSKLYPDIPLESADSEEPAVLGDDAPRMAQAAASGLEEEAMLELISALAGKMTEMQEEIQRLSQELGQARAGVAGQGEHV